jgi:predicted transcriptional regulator YheO
MKKRSAEHKVLFEQLENIARGIGESFAPFCEVVLHDLQDPKHAVLAIHNNLSGRKVGSPATELGLARILDPGFEPVITNYANQFADGRQVKSSSVGIKDSSGSYVAALCVNVDLSLIKGIEGMLAQFSAFTSRAPVKESLDPSGADAIRAHIDRFAAGRATSARALSADDKRNLMRELKGRGLLDLRRAMEIIAAHLGVSRASVYGYAK